MPYTVRGGEGKRERRRRCSCAVEKHHSEGGQENVWDGTGCTAAIWPYVPANIGRGLILSRPDKSGGGGEEECMFYFHGQ